MILYGCFHDIYSIFIPFILTSDSFRKMLDLVEWLDESMLIQLTPSFLKGYPNTYAYTKCLTEQLVADYNAKLPIVIARPSIGESSFYCFFRLVGR